jgi:hypothetical protein
MAANVSVVHSEALFGILLFHAWVKNRIPLWPRFRVLIVKHPSEQEEVGDEKVVSTPTSVFSFKMSWKVSKRRSRSCHDSVLMPKATLLNSSLKLLSSGPRMKI